MSDKMHCTIFQGGIQTYGDEQRLTHPKHTSFYASKNVRRTQLSETVCAYNTFILE